MYIVAMITALSAAALAAPTQIDARQATSYVSCYGDGAPGPAPGFPGSDEWVDFDTLFDSYSQIIANSCSKYNVPLNSADETAAVRSAIQDVANYAVIDSRFILAIALQETVGYVRAPGRCNNEDGVSTPCPTDEIEDQIRDGATDSAGLPNNLQADPNGDNGPRITYRAARLYDSGSVAPSGDLSDPASADNPSFSADIANRLRGVVFEDSQCVAE